MKLRITIAVFLSLLLTISTFFVWAHISPIPISFSLDSKDTENKKSITIYYATRPQKIYTTKKSQSPSPTFIGGKMKVSCTFDTIKIAKIQIVLAGFKGQELTISDFMAKGLWETDLSDIGKIEALNLEILERNNQQLRIKPLEDFVSLELYFNRTLFLGITINILLLISCFTLILLMVNQIIQIAVNIRTKEKHSYIAIVFIFIFFVTLFVPALNVSNERIFRKENRPLASYKGLFIDGKINLSFGEDFESWFNDHFFGRGDLIIVYDFLNNLININYGNVYLSRNVLLGDEGWLFYRGGNSVSNFLNKDLFTTNELQYIAKYLSDIDTWCKAQGKSFYYIIAPDKNRMYGKFYPAQIKVNLKNLKSRATQLVDYLDAHTEVRTLYLYDVLHKNKDKGLLYWKQDTHWNELGAYIAYQEIMSMIDPNKEQELFVATNFPKKPNGRMDLLHMQRKVDPDTTHYVNVEKKHVYQSIPVNNQSQLHKNTHGKKNLLIVGDSFSELLLPYFGESFMSIRSGFRSEMIADDLDYIKNKADIIILEQVERHIPALLSDSFLEVK